MSSDERKQRVEFKPDKNPQLVTDYEETKDMTA